MKILLNLFIYSNFINVSFSSSQNFFSTFVFIKNIVNDKNLLDSFLPNDLSCEDRESVLYFICNNKNNLLLRQNQVLYFTFYKDDIKPPKLSKIEIKKLDCQINTPVLHQNKTIELEKTTKYIQETNISLYLDKSNYCAREKNNINQYIALINLNFDTKNIEHRNKKQFIFINETKNYDSKVIGIQVKYNNIKYNFYILSSNNKQNILVDEQGYIIHGNLLYISKNLPVINANSLFGSPFGYRRHPILRRRKFHEGQDIKASCGASIYSLGSGLVLFAGYNKIYGYAILIYHGEKINEGYSTLYAHCSKLNVKVGQTVHKGQLIGFVGSTGRSTGPHLHLEVIDNKTKKRVNPRRVYSLSTVMIPQFLIKKFLKQKQKIKNILKKH